MFCTSAKSKDYSGTPLPISQRCLECVDDELSALAVKILSSLMLIDDWIAGLRSSFRGWLATGSPT